MPFLSCAGVSAGKQAASELDGPVDINSCFFAWSFVIFNHEQSTPTIA